MFKCRYLNKKDCADITLKEPHTCFWTTPNLHWKDSECLNGKDMLVDSQTGIQTLQECVHRCEEEKYSTCKEMAYNSVSKTCNLYKAVTFDERCTRKSPGVAGW